MPSASIHSIREVLDDERLHSASVRVLGQLQDFNSLSQRATIEDRGRKLTVDTSLIGPFPFRTGSTLQFIGEIRTTRAPDVSALGCSASPARNEALGSAVEPYRGRLLLHARVVQDADGVDHDLRERALAQRRAFLSDARFVQQHGKRHGLTRAHND